MLGQGAHCTGKVHNMLSCRGKVYTAQVRYLSVKVPSSISVSRYTGHVHGIVKVHNMLKR